MIYNVNRLCITILVLSAKIKKNEHINRHWYKLNQ